MTFISGIVLAKVLTLPVYVWLILSLFALLCAFLLIRPPRPLSLLFSRLPALRIPPTVLTISRPAIVLMSFSLASLLLGAVRYQSALPQSTISQIAWFNDRQYDLLITGTLVEPPDYRDTYTNLRLQAQQVDTAKEQYKVSGLLLARVGPNQEYHYGDILRLRGRLQTPPADEDFSYRDYLARQGIRSYMGAAEATVLPGSGGNPVVAVVYGLKERSLQNIYRLFLDPEASLLAGILLGVDSGLPSYLEQAFNDTGTSHIIAISGFNIAVVAGIFVLLFSRLLGPRWGALAAVIGIVFYTFLVGASPSVVRAAFMGTLALLAAQLGRRQQGLNALALVAAWMALLNPLVLWDVGFQLSFFATLGLILYSEPFQAAVDRFLARFFPAARAHQSASLFGEFVLLTLAAQLTTLPIAAYHFKQISLVSFVANPFILPVQPAVMVLGGLAVSISLVLYPLGQLAAWIAWPLTAYTIRVVELFDSVPHGVIYLGGFSMAFVVLYYAVLMAITFAGPNLKSIFASLQARFRYFSLTAILLSLFVCIVLVWRLVAATSDGRLHITFLSVGSADAALIQTPTGRNILINGGPSASAASDGLGRRLSPLDHTLDWLVLADTEENQVASLDRLVPRFPPRNVLLGANEQASFSSRALMQQLADRAIPVTPAEAGQQLDLGRGAFLKVLNLSPRGAILLVEWNSFRALLPIGENLDTLVQLQEGSAVGPINVLSLAQSGYAPLTPPAWLRNLNPQLVVISVAAGDKSGLPDKDTLDALAGYSFLRTDLNGWISVMTDGSHMWVQAERP